MIKLHHYDNYDGCRGLLSRLGRNWCLWRRDRFSYTSTDRWTFSRVVIRCQLSQWPQARYHWRNHRTSRPLLAFLIYISRSFAFSLSEWLSPQTVWWSSVPKINPNLLVYVTINYFAVNITTLSRYLLYVFTITGWFDKNHYFLLRREYFVLWFNTVATAVYQAKFDEITT